MVSTLVFSNVKLHSKIIGIFIIPLTMLYASVLPCWQTASPKLCHKINVIRKFSFMQVSKYFVII